MTTRSPSVGTALPPATSPSPTPTSASQATSTTPTPPPTTSNGVTSSNPLSSSPTTATSSSATSAQSSISTGSSSTTSLSTPQVDPSSPPVVGPASTSIVVATTTSTPSSRPASSNSFFTNKGAVAGVFSVVGLIILALAIALIVNAVRRRRAQKFDRDVAEAAAEAAASPRSPFDDYNGSNGGGGGGGGGYGYSDNSHGTYQLPPLSPQQQAYGMSEMSQYDPYAAGAATLAASAVGRSRSRKDSEPGTPGIAGVGAGTLAREPSKRAPYHAFAGPGPQLHELQRGNGTFRGGRGNQDIFEAAGLAATGAAASNNLGNNASGAYVTRQPSEATQNTLSGRSKFGSMSSGGHHPTPLQPGYPVDSYYPQRSDTLSPDPFAVYPPVLSAPSNALPNPHDVSAPLPSPPEHQTDHEDPVPGSPTALRSDEQRMSYQDDTDYSQGNRILRVANA